MKRGKGKLVKYYFLSYLQAYAKQNFRGLTPQINRNAKGNHVNNSSSISICALVLPLPFPEAPHPGFLSAKKDNNYCKTTVFAETPCSFIPNQELR